MAKPARAYHTQQTHYISVPFSFTDTAQKEIGTLPAGATIIKPISGIQVNTAFNAGSSNAVDIGTSANDDLYATDIAAGAVDFAALDEAVALTMTEDTTLYVKYVPGGTAASAGEGVAVIHYIL